MTSQYYVQQYGREYSEVLLSKQPIPEKILSSVKHWVTVHDVEFHTVDGATLYVSGKKTGVFMTKAEGLSHVLVRKPGGDSFWNFQAVSSNSLTLLEEALTAETVERIADYMNKHMPITDFNEFRETHARLEAERQTKWDEEDRIKVEKVQRRKEEEDRKHAEAMQMAAVEFLKGDEIGADVFCELLKTHGVWPGVHPKTKHFIQQRLTGVQNNGQYRYLVFTSLRGRKRTHGSAMVSDLARRLNTLLEASPTPDTVNGAFSGVQQAA